MRNFFKKFKKPTLIILAIALSLVLLSQTTEGKRLLLPAGLIDAVRSFFADNPNLSAADYKDGTIILIKPMATGVGEGRYEAGDIVEIRGGEEMYKRFGNGDFLGSSEKTNLLPVYYPGKLTEEQKKDLLAPEYETERNKMILRRKVGVDYTKFLNTDEVLKVRSFEKLDRLPEIDLSSIIKKSSEQKSVIKIPEYLIRIENFQNSVKKIARAIIPFAKAASGTKTICSSGCNYTTLSAWEAGEQADLTGTGPAIAQITGGFQDTTAVNINGWTTTAADYIYIYTTPAARHSGKWDTNKYRLAVSNNNRPILVSENYVRIDGLQISNDTTTSYGVGILTRPDGTKTNTDIIISNNIIRTTVSPTYNISGLDLSYGAVYKVWNNILYDFSNSSIGAQGIFIWNDSVNGLSDAYLYNNTIYNSYRGIWTAGSGTTIAKNNIVKGSGDTNSYVGTFASGTDYNATDGTDNIGQGSNNKISQTFQFVDETNDDFHLAPFDAAAKDSGTSVWGDANLSFNTDIDGNHRPQGASWDIGADEYGHKTVINTPLSGRFKDSSLVGYWSFDGANMGTTSATDLSGNSNTGWLLNGPKKVPGINGQALNFDGVNDYVNAAPESFMANATQGTFTAWINPRSGGSSAYSEVRNAILGKISTPDNALGFVDGQNKIRFRLGSGGTNLDGNILIPLGNWTHVVGTWNSSGMNIYVNGILDNFNAVAATWYDNLSPPNYYPYTLIGRVYNESTDGSFNGLIDEVRVYNRALSAMEIAEQYRAGAARMKVNSPPSAPFGNSGLVGYWSFNGPDTTWTSATAGTTADKSGNGNTGTMTNMSRSTSPVPGISGQALSFDGVNDWISVPDSNNSLDASSAVTVSAWFYPKSNAAGWYIIAAKGAGVAVSDSNYYLARNGQKFYLTFEDGTGWHNHSTNQNYAPNQWYHLLGVIDSDNDSMKIYVNNQLDINSQSETANMVTNNTALSIGYNVNNGIWTDGLIDEVRVYNRALSADEISQLYRLGTRKFQPTQ